MDVADVEQVLEVVAGRVLAHHVPSGREYSQLTRINWIYYLLLLLDPCVDRRSVTQLLSFPLLVDLVDLLNERSVFLASIESICVEIAVAAGFAIRGLLMVFMLFIIFII